MALTVLVETPQVQEDAKTKVTGETSNIRTVETQDSTLLVNLEEDEFIQHTFSSLRTSDVADPTQLEETSIKPAQHQILSEEGLWFCFNFPLGCDNVDKNMTWIMMF